MHLFFKLLFLAVLPLQIFSQNADDIISQLQLKMNSVNDYAVDATIKSDIPLIKILPVRATIYFKQKDKFRIVSKGIAILPKQGFMDISKLLSQKDSYAAIVAGSELISNTQATIITILPNSDTTDLILAKLWIDTTNDIVLKSQITTRANGTVTIDYAYKTQLNFGLPDNMVFTVDVKKFKIPKGVATDINRTRTETKPPSKTGKVYIQLTNYKINKGVSDDVFKK
jgi:hypothetical protein